MGSGRFHPDAERVTFEDLAKMLEADYLRNGRRSWDRAERSVAHLRETFGLSRAVDITPDRVDAYIAARMGKPDEASASSIQKELAALGRVFHLAHRAGKVANRPAFSSIAVNNARTGFFERDDFERVVDHLPEHLKPVAWFAYLTGWRKGEVVGLMWRNVDLAAGVVSSKSAPRRTAKEGRSPSTPIPSWTPC